MLLEICHTTTFDYSGPAWCEPLLVRLRPREDASQTLLRHELAVEPLPAGAAEWLDLDGNGVACVWFKGVQRQMEIKTTSLVETRRTNPFDFLLLTAARRVPPLHGTADWLLVEHFARPENSSLATTQFAGEVLEATGRDTVSFLNELCARIHDRCRTVLRPAGEPWPPEATLEQRQGACRDLAVLFNEVCRAVGIAARFVSGYAHDADAPQPRHLHAWSEVYLPGGGWRGFDPSIGLATSDLHVPVAASRLPAGAAPTEGTFRGTDVQSRLSAEIEIRQLEAAETLAAPGSQRDSG